MERKPLQVVVLDMQPIMPAIGGGRQRLLGLYHALGAEIQCTYVGSYDWPGELKRDDQVTPSLRELVIPLSAEHHAAAAALSTKLGDRTVIDVAFPEQVALSPDYLAAARAEIRRADVIVFSHPWCFPPLAGAIAPGQHVVYDSHNVEAVLRASLFDDLPEAVPLMHRVVETEYELCRRAHLVLCCSHEDSETFHRVYDIDWTRLRTVPNGIFAFRHQLPSARDRAAAKLAMGVTQDTLVLFLGSGYGPNNDAAQFVNTQLAQRMPKVGFVIVGGCGDALAGAVTAPNVRVSGIVDDERKRLWLTAADLAVNPIVEGSGTCIKMFDYMAAGLPVVTTAIGARGILVGASPAFLTAGINVLPDALARLLENSSQRQALTSSGRHLVENSYSWERISPALGTLLAGSADRSKPAPYFSVVIPTYERHAHLDALIERLDAQSSFDFEVIIIDQSARSWDRARKLHPFPMRYVHSPVRGAVAARNLGGFLARGNVIAFTDDDCQPRLDWLSNARRWFRDSRIVGLEGFIRSDHLDEPDWRPVTNIGCIGLGFMTANLLVRNGTFQQLGGFDLAFDNPHFREDTDFGWRLQDLGSVPFAPDVEVFHPAQPRSNERESNETRGTFFVKDALLLKKHPERYKELFLAEAHFVSTSGFWENFQMGMDIYKVREPSWINQYRAPKLTSS